MNGVKILCLHEPAHLVGWVVMDGTEWVVRYRELIEDVDGPVRGHTMEGRYVIGTHPATGEHAPDFHGATVAKCSAREVCILDFDYIGREARRGRRSIRVPFESRPV